MKGKDIETKTSKINFDDLGMIQVSDEELLAQIAGGMASMESQENLQDAQCNCVRPNEACTTQ